MYNFILFFTFYDKFCITPLRTARISGLKSKVLKSSVLEMIIFGLNTYHGEKWSRKKYFEIPRAPSELLLPSAEKSAQKG